MTDELYRAKRAISKFYPSYLRPVVRQSIEEMAIKAYIDRVFEPALRDGKISSYGVGLKSVDSTWTTTICASISVAKKMPARTRLYEIPKYIYIPAIGKPIPTDVVEAEELELSAGGDPTRNRKRWARKIHGGVSISEVGGTAHTFGVSGPNVTKGLGPVMITAGHCQSSGDEIMQPGGNDKGVAGRDSWGVARSEIIGEERVDLSALFSVFPLFHQKPALLNRWFVDFAHIELDPRFEGPIPRDLERRMIVHIGPVHGILSPFVASGMSVKKSGRSTGLTEGIVVRAYDHTHGNNKNLIKTTAYMEKGDSGSLLVGSVPVASTPWGPLASPNFPPGSRYLALGINFSFGTSPPASNKGKWVASYACQLLPGMFAAGIPLHL